MRVLEEKDEVVEITWVGEITSAGFGEGMNQVYFNTSDGRNIVMWARQMPSIQKGKANIHTLFCQKEGRDGKEGDKYWKCGKYSTGETTPTPEVKPQQAKPLPDDTMSKDDWA